MVAPKVFGPKIYRDLNEFLRKNSAFHSCSLSFLKCTFITFAAVQSIAFALFLANTIFHFLRSRRKRRFLRIKFFNRSLFCRILKILKNH